MKIKNCKIHTQTEILELKNTIIELKNLTENFKSKMTKQKKNQLF